MALAAFLSEQVMMLSLAGIPLTLGFIGKFLLITLGVSAQLWWLTGAVVLGSAIGLYYYLRVTVSLFLSPSQKFPRHIPHHWVPHCRRYGGANLHAVSAVLW
ncbi:hypothetical protein Rin_00022640, partial [Candidatus Regiella insecticola 5.15]